MSTSQVRVVDVHAHAMTLSADALLAGQPGLAQEQLRDSSWLGAAAVEVNRSQLSRLGPLLTKVDQRLAAMDAARVDVQIVAPMPLTHAWTDIDLAERYVGAVNWEIADLGHASGRLIGVGTVALHHPDLAVRQLEHCVGQLGLRGVQIGTTAGELELDSPLLLPFWGRAEELGALVVIHPWGCSLGTRLADYYLGNTVGNPVETTVALSRIVFSGLLDRHPDLDILSVHGGGYLPTYLGRSDHAWHERPDAHTCQRPPSSYLRQLWFDSLVYTPTALRALVDAVGVDRVLLGSDYPFDMGVADPLDRLEAAGFEPPTVGHIAGQNALHLLKRTGWEPKVR